MIPAETRRLELATEISANIERTIEEPSRAILRDLLELDGLLDRKVGYTPPEKIGRFKLSKLVAEIDCETYECDERPEVAKFTTTQVVWTSEYRASTGFASHRNTQKRPDRINYAIECALTKVKI